MSNIKKGAKLTVSTGNGISRHTTQNLGILEVSGPAMSDTTTDYTSNNTAQLTIGATDVSGVLKLGINNDGNTFIDAIKHNNHTDIIMQKYGGDVIIGSGAGSTAKVGIRTNAPNSTFHINSTDGLIIPVGTNGERPDPAYNGMIRYNTTTSQFEGYGPGSAWGSLGGVKDVDGDTYILAESSANADNDDLQFFTAGQERMSINSVGDVSMNGDITTDTGYPYYQSLGTENIVNPPSTALTVHGVNITAMNKRTRASYASAEACVGTWTARSSATEGNSWCSVCWSPELSIFVAVAYAGTNRVMTSPDGITWTARSSASEANDWNSVCWSPELSIFVAVAYGGTNRVMTSPDGITWTARSSASEANTWVSVCWSPELSIFVAVANSGTNRVMTSPDGITWTARSSASEANGWISVCWSPELSIFVAVAYSGTNRVMTSPDGITWTARSSATEANSWQSVCWSPELSIFVAVAVGGTNRVMTSPDGITWTARSSASDANGWRAVCWSPELSIFVAVAYNGTNRVMTSPDGITWTARSSATEANSWYSVCWSPELSIFVAVVPGGTNQVMTSNIGMPNSKSVVKALPTQMSVLPNGNVGIGTFAEEKLVVDGNMRLLGDLNVGLVDADATHAGTLSAGYDFGSQTKIQASDAAANDYFGYSVAISGNYAIVGAYTNDDGGSNSGSAYIFNVSTGTELHKLVAGDPAANDHFGKSVAISGNYAIVGAYTNDDSGTDSGSAYIFNVSTGTQLHKLLAGDAAASDYFGYSVAISGNYAIVGAHGNDDGGADSGSAYIFNVSTGTQLHKLVASDAAAYDNFGISVAISGNYAIVGAQKTDYGSGDSGSAYIFNVNTGTQVQKLLASDAAANDNFGSSVAISGNYAVVGARYNDDPYNSGSAYIFNVSTGTELHKLVASDPAADDYFGYSVAISGNYAIVGAHYNDDGGTDSGSAYIFNVSTGTQLQKLLASDAAASDYFGYSVAISGNYAIVGAYFNDDVPSDSGSAYIFAPSFHVTESGNVGIGTTFAEEKLVVDGNMRLLGDLNVGLVDADATHAGTISVGYDFGTQTKILASDAAANDYFGYSVAISGNYAIVGAFSNDDGGSDSGSAYIFNVSTGTELHKLVAGDAAANDQFGTSVAISGNYAIVSAHANDDVPNDSGSAYIFNVSTGTQLHKLVASDAAAADNFGHSVAISGNYAIVGAPYNDDGSTDSGSAYIFNVSTGTELHKLLAGDAAAADFFGTSVAISGNYAIVGARFNDDVPNNSGSAYIFNVSTGTQVQKLLASDAAANDNFGSSVAISGNYAVVGARYNDGGSTDIGSAYIFNVSTGTELHKLVASDAAAYDNFGISVAISGNYAIVGAHSNDDGGSNSGSAYIFNVSTGTQLQKLLASDASADDHFGYSVAISGNYAIVGAYSNDDGGTDSGSAYIFAPSFHVTESGNVGIGTTFAEEKLVVDGNMRLLGDLNVGLVDADATHAGTLSAGYDFGSQTKILASDAAASDQFGISVAISGNYAIVGAPYNDDGSTNSGSAYIFNVSTGTELHKLVASDANQNDYFGYSVAISGNYAIVGAPYNNDGGTDSGSAYIFNVSTGTELHKLVAIDDAAYDHFGSNVAISGNYAIVGARYNDDGSTDSGSAYIFNVSTGTQLHKLVASDAAATDYFGYSVAISGNYAIVGAYGNDDGGTDSGSAYIFNVSTGTELHKLVASDAAANDQFGTSVAISGNYAIVVASGDDDVPPNSGSAYIFNVSTGTQLHKLVASDAAASDYFGHSVAISGNYAIVSAHANDDGGSNSGSAYIFNVSTGTELHKLVASDAAADDQFGISVAISGNYAIVGAQYNDDGGADSGSAYIFAPSFHVTESGNVGIGTNFAEEKLVVDGNMRLLGDLNVGLVDADATHAGTLSAGYDFGSQTKILASDAAGNDQFGISVAISGNYAIVGARYSDDGSIDSGSAYIFNVSTGTELHKLVASDAAAGDSFGSSVAISGNYAIVGANGDDDGGSASGSAYIFNVSTGTQLHKLVASDAAAADYFGYSVAISGNYAIVGAYNNDDGGADSGSAYIFNVSTGTQLHKLVASDAAVYDYFGYSVAISGNYAIVGANGDDDGGSASGSAYIFNVSTGTQLHKLVASDAAAVDFFGYSVAISGNYAIVGAYGDDGVPNDSGSAYIFNVSTGTQLHKLVANDAAASDNFGYSVAISGNYAIVGAQYNDDGGANSGSAYIFNVSTGTQLHKLLASDAAAVDNFGYSVAISGNYAIVGAPYNDDGGNDSGSAYIFAPSFHVTESGNVGIGTTSPQTKLHVETTITANDTTVPMDSDALNNTVGLYLSNRYSPSFNFGVILGTLVNATGYIQSISNDGNGRNLVLNPGGGNVGIGTTSPDRGLCILDNQNTGQAIGNYYIGYNTSYQEPGALKIFQHLPIPVGTYRISDGGGNLDPAINIITNFIGSGANSGTHQGGCIQWSNQSKDNPTSGGHGQPYAAIYGGRHSSFANYEGEMIFYTSDTTNRASGRNLNPRMTIKGGNVGIGTPTPGAKLHVNGNAQVDGRVLANYLKTTSNAYQSPGSVYGSRYYHASRQSQYIDGFNTGYWCNSGSIMIYNGYLLIASDERIKENITDVPDNLSLDILRNINCNYYEYKDKTIKGEGKTIGFIAQQVNSIFPLAVSKTIAFIPDEMRDLDNISWEEIIDGSDNKYKLTTDLQDTSGVKYAFYVYNDLSNNTQERKEIIGNSDNTFTFDTSYNYVFCYGKEVDDFHTIDKNKLFALNFSATQEIDRIQQQHIIDISNAQATIQTLQTDLSTANTTIQTLQTDLSTANTTIQQQQQQIADILSRLESLESSA